MKIGELLRRVVGLEERPATNEVDKKPALNVVAASATIERAGNNPVAQKNRAVSGKGADEHKPLPATSPVFGANSIPTGEATVVAWVEDCRPMPGDYGFTEESAFDMSLRFPHRGEVISASYGALNGTVLTVACDDGTVRDVDASHVKVKCLADAAKVKWSDDLRPMPGESPVAGDKDPAFDMSLVIERRGIILATSDTFWGGRQHIVACEDGKIRTVSTDHVRALA
jgi:hypothetical protein